MIYLFVNNIIMGQRIILSENEKRNIQKMYGLISEQEKNNEDKSLCIIRGILSSNDDSIGTKASNTFKNITGQRSDIGGCEIYSGVFAKEVLPSLTKDNFNRYEKQLQSEGVIKGSLLSSLINIMGGQGCQYGVAIFKKINDMTRINDLINSCKDSEYLKSYLKEQPMLHKHMVRLLYGERFNQLSSKISNEGIKSVLQKIMGAETIDDSKREIDKYGKDKFVQEYNQEQDRNTKTEINNILRELFGDEGFDSLSNGNLQNIFN